ncbi:hypothetical protein A7U60_g7246 [Sanghuangporus baumii]|uniref:Mediator of RNA polymerase II transcription subunit 11 n=1 Tax=Sanghuangporus baumii TaxID=108892 RepID=A0A9Q5HTJ9_SANBA|nr:hypothetical protein A7U60_g7246 [Sanghuangporus baumii]
MNASESKAATNGEQREQPSERIDPIWTSSRSARQILALTDAERGINKLLSLAASSIALLTLPQTDPADSSLPQGEERSEQFVLEASEYFEQLDQIQIDMRSSLAHIRQSRIPPSAIDAPPPNFIPQPAGVGTPMSSSTSENPDGVDGYKENDVEEEDMASKRGLQEERLNRDAWRGVLDALTRLKQARERENANRMDTSS